MSYVFKAGVEKVIDVKITNLAVTTSESSHTLTDGLKQLIVKARNGAVIQFSFVSGESASKYMTLDSMNSLSMENLLFMGKTIYITASKNDILEIMELY